MLLHTLSFEGALYGVLVFVVYAMGIGLPMIVISIFATKIREVILRKVMEASYL